MHRRRTEQDILLAWNKCSVGGQDHLKSMLTGQFQKLFQFGVTERFSHQVKIQVIAPGTQFGQKKGKFFL